VIKNTASQTIGAQLVSATDGSAFTSAVTVSVTIDAGVQALGSVGAGACTHEGNGYHTYAPAQAESNGDLIAFTFTGSGAVPATVQVYTIAGDPFTRLGAPAGASVSVDLAAVKAQTAVINADTDDLQTRVPAALVGGRMDSSVGAMAANVITATAINADAITDAKVAADVTIASVTGAVGSVTGAVGSVTGLTAATVHSDLDDLQARLPAALVGGRIDASVGAMAANVVTAAALAADAVDEILDDPLTDAVPADGALPTLRQAIYMIVQFLTERSVSGTTVTVRKVDGTTALMTFTLDSAVTPTSLTRAT